MAVPCGDVAARPTTEKMALSSWERLRRGLRARVFLGIRIVLDALTLVFILLIGRGVSLATDHLFLRSRCC